MNWMQKDVQTSAQMEIAWQCVPVLTGVKPSNILTLKNVSEKEVAESLKEMGISYADISKAKKLLNWSPRLDLYDMCRDNWNFIVQKQREII